MAFVSLGKGWVKGYQALGWMYLITCMYITN